MKIRRLNKKLVLEEEKNKLEEEFSNVYTGSLKAGYFLMIVSSLMKNYLDCQLARKLRNIKLYMNIWILEKIVKILNTMNLQKIMKKIGQMFCLHQAFCHLHQNQDLDLNLLVLIRLGSPLKHTAWLFNLTKSSASRYIITWANFIYFKLDCVPIWPTKDIVIETMLECFKATYPNTRVIIDCTASCFVKNDLI